MNTPIEFCGYTLTDDEAEACMALLQDIWEKKRKEKFIQKCKAAIFFQVSETIDRIGLEETKRIVHEINKELREKAED